MSMAALPLYFSPYHACRLKCQRYFCAGCWRCATTSAGFLLRLLSFTAADGLSSIFADGGRRAASVIFYLHALASRMASAVMISRAHLRLSTRYMPFHAVAHTSTIVLRTRLSRRRVGRIIFSASTSRFKLSLFKMLPPSFAPSGFSLSPGVA